MRDVRDSEQALPLTPRQPVKAASWRVKSLKKICLQKNPQIMQGLASSWLVALNAIKLKITKTLRPPKRPEISRRVYRFHAGCALLNARMDSTVCVALNFVHGASILCALHSKRLQVLLEGRRGGAWGLPRPDSGQYGGATFLPCYLETTAHCAGWTYPVGLYSCTVGSRLFPPLPPVLPSPSVNHGFGSLFLVVL